MEDSKIYTRKAAWDKLRKYDYLAKDDDFIEVTVWKNGEGYDISISDDNVFSLSIGQLEAINFLTKRLDYDEK